MPNEDYKLEPCPFCLVQSHLKLECKSSLSGFNGLDWRVERHIWSVRCNVCHARGPAVGGNVIDHLLAPEEAMPSWATTDEELKAKAIILWNRGKNDA